MKVKTHEHLQGWNKEDLIVIIKLQDQNITWMRKEIKMLKKEIKILDDLIGYLATHADRISITRISLGINTDYDFLREVETIESLYRSILQDRKKLKSNFFFVSSSGWTVQYMRTNKTYKKDEKYNLHIFFSFVEVDTFK